MTNRDGSAGKEQTSVAPRIACRPESVPEELKQLKRWVVWKAIPSRDPKDKPRKVPIDAKTGRAASATNESTWSTFDEAVARFQRGGYAGIGFVFAEGDGYCGIDLDDCVDDDGVMEPWAREIVELFDTYTERSPSGRGAKLLFRATKPPSSPCRGAKGSDLAKLECYDRGRYFALTGERWTGAPAEIGARQEQLESLVARLKRPRTASSSDTPALHSGAEAPGPDARDHGSVLKRASAYLAKMEPSISGARGHDHAYAAACVLVHGFELDVDVAFDLLMREFNPRCVPPWSEKELRHKVKEAKTKPHDRSRGWLLNAESAMSQRHAEVPGIRTESSGSNDRVGASAAASGREPPHAVGVGPHAPGGPPPLALTDTGNAERFARDWGDDLRYCHDLGVWLVWDGRRWREDDAGLPHLRAMESARRIQQEGMSGNSHDRGALIKWGLTSESRKQLDAMVALARSMPSLVMRSEELDSDPWLFNVQNGTIDLRDGGLRPHSRDDRITMLAPVEFDSNATCQRFDAFLRRILPDREVAEFVLRFLGHALTGRIDEQVLPIFYGTGGNGKSVLMDSVAGLMGDYAGQAPPSLLVMTNRDEHPTELAGLRGKRLVIASETEEGAALKAQLLKKLTGDQWICARKMRQDFFEFKRTHKTILVTNNAPRVRENSEAMWRRLRLVKFGVVIPEDDQDPGLLGELQKEWPGVLARLVRACVEWQNEGLSAPDSVRESTAAYRENEDVVGRFLSELCSVDVDGPESERPYTPWNTLYQAYCGWAQDSGERPLGARRFGEALTLRGIGSVTCRVNGTPTKCRTGVALCFDPSTKNL